MSTKIYRSWRMSVSVFHKEFLPTFHECCMQNVVQRVKSIACEVTDERMRRIYEKKYVNVETKPTFDDFKTEWRMRIGVREFLKLAYQASEDIKRDFIFDLDCGFSVWFHGNKAYVIPYGENWTYDGLKLPEKVEDYAYWNNTDRPTEITSRQWRTREKNWNTCLKNWNKQRLVHSVVNISDDIGVVEIAKAILGDDRQIVLLTIGLDRTDYRNENTEKEKDPFYTIQT